MFCFLQLLVGRQKWLYLVNMFYCKARQNPWGVCRHKAGEQRICVCEGKSVLVTITVMPFPDRRWSTSLQYQCHIPPCHALSNQTAEKLDFLVFLIQTSLVFNGVIISTPSESLSLITCEINVNEWPTPSFWPKKLNQNPSRLTERKKRENICFPSLTVCISYPQIRSVYLCSRMFSKPSVQRD